MAKSGGVAAVMLKWHLAKLAANGGGMASGWQWRQLAARHGGSWRPSKAWRKQLKIKMPQQYIVLSWRNAAAEMAMSESAAIGNNENGLPASLAAAKRNRETGVSAYNHQWRQLPGGVEENGITEMAA